MKKLALIVIGILMLAGCDAPAMKMEVKDNGPDGFFGLTWKSSVKQAVENNIVFPFGRQKRLTPGVEYEPRQKLIGDVQMGSYSHMSFYKDRFYEYYGLFTGEENYDKLRTALLTKYGDPKGQELKRINWQFNHSFISLNYDTEKGSGTIGFVYIQIFQEVMRVDKTQSDL